MSAKSIFLLDKAQFDHWARMAQTMADSSLGIPTEYRGNVGNCLNAIEIALRLKVSPIVVMQNLRNMGEYGNPVWSANFVRAMVDQSGLFTEPLRFEVVSETTEENYRVRAVATSVDGKLKTGEWITWTMAEIMGWTANRNWEAIPAVMFRARAGNAFGIEHCNSLLMGFLEDDAKASPAESVTELQTKTPQAVFAPFMDQLQTAQVPAAIAQEGKTEGSAPDAKPMDKPDLVKDAELTAPLVGAPAASIIDDISAVLQMTETAKVPAPASQEGGAGSALTAPGKSEAEAAPKVRKPRAPKATEEGVKTQTPPSLQAGLLDEALPPIESFGSPAQGNTTPKPGTQTHLEREMERAAVFSNALVEIEKAEPTKAGLESAIAVADSFGEPEKVDLYGIVLNQVGAQIEKMAHTPQNLGEPEKAFLATARTLHSNTKDLVANHPEVAETRARLGKAYTAMINVVAQLTAAKASSN